MFWISDREAGAALGVEPSSGGGVLQRFLAVILFGGALIFGSVLPLVVIGTIAPGRAALPAPWWIPFFAGGIAWVCGWLAMLLWSGRSIPRWFLGGWLYAVCLVAGVASFAKGDWESGSCMLGMMLGIFWLTPDFFATLKKKQIPEL